MMGVPRMKRSMCWLLFVALAVLHAEDDRDFSGDWTLDRKQSEISASQPSPSERLSVAKEGSVIKSAGFRNAVLTYSLDGKDTRDTSGETTFDTRTKWEGAALLTDTLVNEPHASYTVMERWRLSRDHNTLTIRRQIAGRDGRESESNLVYRREGASVAAPPALIARQPQPAPAPEQFIVEKGTRIPLRLRSTVSTKTAGAGDRVYLDTIYPIRSAGRIVIPPGSSV